MQNLRCFRSLKYWRFWYSIIQLSNETFVQSQPSLDLIIFKLTKKYINSMINSIYWDSNAFGFMFFCLLEFVFKTYLPWALKQILLWTILNYFFFYHLTFWISAILPSYYFQNFEEPLFSNITEHWIFAHKSTYLKFTRSETSRKDFN